MSDKNNRFEFLLIKFRYRGEKSEMSSFFIKRSRSRSLLLWQTHGIKIRSILFSSYNSLSDAAVSTRSFKTTTFGFKSGKVSHLNEKFGIFAYSGGSNFVSTTRPLSSEAVAVAATCDGLTVERIIANQWPILDENDSDWKSHAAAISQSIQVIKRRLQVIKKSKLYKLTIVTFYEI